MPDRREWKARAVAEPQPGFFLIRLVRKGPQVPARICHENGVWWAIVDSQTFPSASDPAAAPRVFPIWHGGEEITEAEYQHRLALKRWAQAHQPDHPAANPGRPIDLTTQRSIF